MSRCPERAHNILCDQSISNVARVLNQSRQDVFESRHFKDIAVKHCLPVVYFVRDLVERLSNDLINQLTRFMIILLEHL